jgi:hypothetical protein
LDTKSVWVCLMRAFRFFARKVGKKGYEGVFFFSGGERGSTSSNIMIQVGDLLGYRISNGEAQSGPGIQN